MLNVSFENNPEIYTDIDSCMAYLRTVKPEQHPWPEGMTTFHVYTEVKSPKELMVIKSFLATQDLNRCQLVVWSDISIETNPLIQSYRDYITLKVWDPIEEAKGTPLEGYHDILSARDYLYWIQSDLLRLLALYKYGGIWVDMDIIFLRDFRPILDQEFMYAWSADTDFASNGACGSVLGLERHSELAARLLEAVITTPYREATTCWGRNIFAEVYRETPYSVLPCGFFNTEWISDDTTLEDQLFEKALENNIHLFEDAFAWHWHNSSNKEQNVSQGSKFDRLEAMIHSKLEFKGIAEAETRMVNQFRHATTLKEAGELEQAAHSCEDIISEAPEFSLAIALLAEIQISQGQLERALQSYQKALKSPFARVNYVINTLTLMRRIRSPEAVLACAHREEERFCDHPQLQIDMGIIYEQVGDIDQAISSYERAMQLRGADSYPYLRLGLVYRQLSQLPLAVEYLEIAFKVARSPTSLKPVILALRLCYYELGNFQKALEIARHMPTETVARVA